MAIRGVTLALFALVALAPAAVHAQRGMRMGPMHYDPATETTVTGTVAEVKNTPAPGRGMGGIHLVFDAPDGRVDVRVGPAAFVEGQHVTFAAGDSLTITGSKTTIDSQQVIVAREIRKGDQVLTLRNAQGFPLWSGRGGRF